MEVSSLKIPRIPRPEIGSISLSAIVALYLLLATNNSFWAHANVYFDHAWMSLLAFAAALYLVLFAILTPLSVKYLMKPALVILILVSATASYFADTFGIVIDRDMIGNAAVTTQAEASHLLTFSLARHLLVYAVLPSILIAWVRVRHRRLLRKAPGNLAIVYGKLHDGARHDN